MHQACARGECRARGHAQCPAHARGTSYNHYASAVALVVSSPEPPEPVDGVKIGDRDGPARIGWGMADVDHHDGAYLISRQQVPPAKSTEGHGEIRAGTAVHHPG